MKLLRMRWISLRLCNDNFNEEIKQTLTRIQKKKKKKRTHKIKNKIK